MKRIILDTDVGTDVDDALALALLAASPELQVEGVTTVHADAPLRARIARALLDFAGREDVPVVAGASRPFGSEIPLVIVPIEVTTQVYLSPEQRLAMRAWRHPLPETLVVLMEQMQESFSDFSRTLGLTKDIFQGRTYMHDPLAVYVSMAHELVTLRETHIRLEVRNNVLRTVPYTDRPRNTRVCQEVDAPAFVQFWLERVEWLVASSPTRP